ncbi:hypothetical protein Hanom_Chr08g00736671 [Helianthus anomalus]
MSFHYFVYYIHFSILVYLIPFFVFFTIIIFTLHSTQDFLRPLMARHIKTMCGDI